MTETRPDRQRVQTRLEPRLGLPAGGRMRGRALVVADDRLSARSDVDPVDPAAQAQAVAEVERLVAVTRVAEAPLQPLRLEARTSLALLADVARKVRVEAVQPGASR